MQNLSLFLVTILCLLDVAVGSTSASPCHSAKQHITAEDQGHDGDQYSVSNRSLDLSMAIPCNATIEHMQSFIKVWQQRTKTAEQLNEELLDTVCEQRVHFLELLVTQQEEHKAEMELKNATIKYLRGLLKYTKTQVRIQRERLVLMGESDGSESEHALNSPRSLGTNFMSESSEGNRSDAADLLVQSIGRDEGHSR